MSRMSRNEDHRLRRIHSDRYESVRENTEYFTLKRRQKANAHDAFKSKVTPRGSNRNYENLTGDGIFFSVIVAPIEFNGSIKMRNSRQDSALVFGEGYLGNRG